jgi:hypothetical protein
VHLVKVVAIDPGGTTGICLVDDADVRWSAEIRTIPHLVDVLGKLLAHQHPDAVVIEDFVGSGAAKNYYDPVRVIGAVEAVMAGSHLPLVKQVPGKQLRYRDEVASKSKSPHVRSALAHAFYYLKRQGRI